MQKKKKTVITTLAILGGLGLASVGTSAAMASTPSAPPSTSTSSSTETTTPETAGATETPDAPETGATAESSTANDGPGGHADAPGADVNHEGGDSEK